MFVGVYLLTGKSGARRQQDLEAGLMTVAPNGEGPTAPLVDMPSNLSSHAAMQADMGYGGKAENQVLSFQPDSATLFRLWHGPFVLL